MDRNAPLSQETDLFWVRVRQGENAAFDLGRVKAVRYPFLRHPQRSSRVFMPARPLQSGRLIEQNLHHKDRWQQEELSRESRRLFIFIQGGFDSVWVIPGQLTLRQAAQTSRLQDAMDGV